MCHSISMKTLRRLLSLGSEMSLPTLLFSEGEKMRIDLALLFTWRTIAKMKNSANTNLLILDEIFDSSLDGQGTDDFLKILHTVSDNTNVFVISHKTESLQDKFASTLQVEKKQKLLSNFKGRVT